MASVLSICDILASEVCRSAYHLQETLEQPIFLGNGQQYTLTVLPDFDFFPSNSVVILGFPIIVKKITPAHYTAE